MRILAFAGLSWPILLGCSGSPSPKQAAFEQAKQNLDYAILASTRIGRARVEIWKESGPAIDAHFGRMLIVAIAEDDEIHDFCVGRFVSSIRPYFQTDRYLVLAAADVDGGSRDAFFVYHADSGSFSMHVVAMHIHENIVIVGDLL